MDLQRISDAVNAAASEWAGFVHTGIEDAGFFGRGRVRFWSDFSDGSSEPVLWGEVDGEECDVYAVAPDGGLGAFVRTVRI